ncbi:MAG: Stp1/IreP family PP2C-type Ser/Thr phosphatase [Polyangiaceae bacterium]|nr:Stp1/IreP family PP2C-type Ser/Thr phosphatase [Polyangiaceae bacterium]
MSEQPSAPTDVERPADAEKDPPDEHTQPDRPHRQEIRVRIFGRTDVGQVREHNEDNFLVADLTRGTRGLMEADRTQILGDRGAVFGVCDGMGGAAAGEVASQLAVDIIHQKMSQSDAPAGPDDLAARLVRSIEAAGLRIFTEAKLDRSRRGMGTTSTISALMDKHLFVGQVGDSRAYILRGERLVQVTRDQSLVTQLIEAGQLTEEEAETFEHNNIILQALGTSDTVQVDLTHVELRRGDTLMLCSDGLSGMIRNDEIREILRSVDDPLESCKLLTDRANQAGGHDNITVVVAKFEGEGLDGPTQDDIDRLRYEKYQLPTRSQDRAETLPEPRRVKELETQKISVRPPAGYRENAAEEDDSDGLAEPDYDRFHANEPVQIPVETAPQWLIVMMIASAVACMLVVVYVYVIR